MKKLLLYLLMGMSAVALAAETPHTLVFLPVQSYDPEIPQALITGCRERLKDGLLARGIKLANADAAIYALSPQQRENLALLAPPDYLRMSDSSGAERFIQLTISNYNFFLRSVYVVECNYYSFLATSAIYGYIRVISETGEVLVNLPLDLTTAYRHNAPVSADEEISNLLDAAIDDAILTELVQRLTQQ